METLWQDLKYGARMLLRNKGFTIIAVLALGIGANTAIFSVVNAVLLRPLPYPQAERIVQADWRWPKGEGSSVTATEYVFWKEHSRSFEEAAAYASAGAGFNLAGGSEPQRVRGLRVSENFLRVLGITPALGRGFLPEEDRPQAACAAMITDGLWRNAFGGNKSAIGKGVELNGRSCAVVGILPQGFQFDVPTDVFMPLQLKDNPRDQGHNTTMIARLTSGVSFEQAQAEMDALLPQFREQYPGHIHQGEKGILLVSYRQAVVGDVSKFLLLLFGAVGFVLLIACANVANLLLARAANRKGEMAVRIALGAGRLRLLRQLMTENALLALVGGGVGLLFALWSVPLLLALSPADLPRAVEIELDAQAMLFAISASLVTSLLFGIAPALQATRLDVNNSLKASSGKSGVNARSGRARGLLLVSEVALSLMLLIGAALLIESFVKLRAVGLGFEPQNLTTMQVSLNSAKYRTTAQAWNLERQVMERISTLPGVAAVATVPSLPMERGLNENLTIEGRPDANGLSLESRAISPDYFRTLNIPLLRGRAFAETDVQGSLPVLIINETLARRFWPDRDPVGEQVALNTQKRQIVGVVKDIREMGLNQPVAPTVYMPTPQLPDAMMAATNNWFLTSWIVRTKEPLDINTALRNAVREVDPQLPVANIRPMTQVVSASIATQRFITTLMGVFAALALALTAVGLYGTLSYQVSQRTHEIGIRMALGAQARDVFKLIVGQGLRLALIGVAAGLLGAFAVTRVMESLLYGVSATDPLIFACVALLLTFVALLACYVPARRATKVDPMIALRYE